MNTKLIKQYSANLLEDLTDSLTMYLLNNNAFLKIQHFYSIYINITSSSSHIGNNRLLSKYISVNTTMFRISAAYPSSIFTVCIPLCSQRRTGL